jgi:hypothetical protein
MRLHSGGRHQDLDIHHFAQPLRPLGNDPGTGPARRVCSGDR